ncbi:aminotransferase [Thermoanaerobacter sp. YS13]|uniref:amylo-alpha-1,6-glucosidase n=1 Tax=Thermoanaerobacter sp. YS13 TaxID=1511746 RepID=UPI000573F5CF|nr:aminotransferase [Thermoanaerobacter sp. YS13]KHO63056.1 aminotransferase [Thermoanaerobacter sp. YS13]
MNTCKEGKIISEKLWFEPVNYDISNRKITAQFDGNGNINYYSIVGLWDIFVPSSWYNGWAIDGERLPITHKKNVLSVGNYQEIIYEIYKDIEITVKEFCGIDNEIYIIYHIKNKGKIPAIFNLHFGAEIDLVSFYKFSFLQDKKFFNKIKILLKNINFAGKNKLPITMKQEDELFTIEYANGFNLMLGSSYLPRNVRREDIKFGLVYQLEIEKQSNVSIPFVIDFGEKLKKDEWCLKLKNWEKALQETEEYVNWLVSRFKSENDYLNSLYTSCINTSLSTYKESKNIIRGFIAGVNYQNPPRTYYRDGYWTIQSILPYKPKLVKEEILSLAYGIDNLGKAPSAVILLDGTAFWENHADSPLYFVMMIYDYLAWTNDNDFLYRKVKNEPLIALIERIISNYDIDLKTLDLKTYNRNDWVDNIYRRGFVAYDLLLYIKAVMNYAEILEYIGQNDKAMVWYNKAELLKERLIGVIEKYGFINYKNQEMSEKNFSIEWNLAVIFDLLSEEYQYQIISKSEQLLETKNNKEQPFGDWGIMVCYPLYTNIVDLVEKSIDPFRYHNGSDWPYWDGIYAWGKLKLGKGNWEYPLLKWFKYSLEQDWLTPVEYYSPVFPKGSNLQGWSSTSAAAILQGGLGMSPSLTKKIKLKVPPWGDCEFRGIQYRGKIMDIIVENNAIKIYCDGKECSNDFKEVLL